MLTTTNEKLTFVSDIIYIVQGAQYLRTHIWDLTQANV